MSPHKLIDLDFEEHRRKKQAAREEDARMLAAGEITKTELRRKNSLLHRMGLDPQSGVILNWQPGYKKASTEQGRADTIQPE